VTPRCRTRRGQHLWYLLGTLPLLEQQAVVKGGRHLRRKQAEHLDAIRRERIGGEVVLEVEV
jgi:hypothetical protein